MRIATCRLLIMIILILSNIINININININIIRYYGLGHLDFSFWRSQIAGWWWKVSRPVLEERVRITWLNIIRVRRLCVLAHGYDPVMEGWDQKPFHFNESGSQMAKTLHLERLARSPAQGACVRSACEVVGLHLHEHKSCSF